MAKTKDKKKNWLNTTNTVAGALPHTEARVQFPRARAGMFFHTALLGGRTTEVTAELTELAFCMHRGPGACCSHACIHVLILDRKT